MCFWIIHSASRSLHATATNVLSTDFWDVVWSHFQKAVDETPTYYSRKHHQLWYLSWGFFSNLTSITPVPVIHFHSSFLTYNIHNAMFTWKVNDLNSRSKNFLGLWPAVLLGELLPVGEQTNKASVTVQRTFWANKGPKSPDSRSWQEIPTCHQNSACRIPNFFYFPLWLIPTELDLCELLKWFPLMLLVHSLQQEVGISA